MKEVIVRGLAESIHNSMQPPLFMVRRYYNIVFSNDSGWIRTIDRLLRRQLLYSAELLSHVYPHYKVCGKPCQLTELLSVFQYILWSSVHGYRRLPNLTNDRHSSYIGLWSNLLSGSTSRQPTTLFRSQYI